MPALTQLALVGIALLEPSSAPPEAVAVRARVAPSCPEPADIARRIRSSLADAPLTEPLAIDLEITARRGRTTLELEVSHRLFTARERYHDADCDALVDMAALYVASIFPTIHAREQEVEAAAPVAEPPPTRGARRWHRRYKGTGDDPALGAAPRRGARTSRRRPRRAAQAPEEASLEVPFSDPPTPKSEPRPRRGAAARVSAVGAALLGGDDPNLGLGPDLRAALGGRRWRIEAG
ncbi:MAG: hypothetical protein KC486_17490, partial [Myxococcales bacterium]|nr:hypothetical protein [Myxococcales bacterium]